VVSAQCKQHIVEIMGESTSAVNRLLREIAIAQSKVESVVETPISQFFENGFRREIDKHSQLWKPQNKNNRDKILKEFHQRFQADSEKVLEEWIQEVVLQDFLEEEQNLLDCKIHALTQNFQKMAESVDVETGTHLSQQFKMSLQRRIPNFSVKSQTQSDTPNWQFWNTGIGGGVGLGTGGLFAGGVAAAVSSVAFFPVVLTGASIAGIAMAGAALGTSIGAALGFFGASDPEQIRQEVLEKGLSEFLTEINQKKLRSTIQQFIDESFCQQVKTMNDMTNEYLEILSSLLVEREKSAHLKSVQIEAENIFPEDFKNRLQLIKFQIK
jgi:hypothetical protein